MLEIKEEKGSLRFLEDGKLVTRYHFDDSGEYPVPSKPYFYPLLFDGLEVTRKVPGRGEAAEKDHPHHRSLYVAYGDVAGSDVWSEEPGHGFQRHGRFLKTWAGPSGAGFEEELAWESRDGAKLLEEKRRFALSPLENKGRFLDLEVRLKASEKDVLFGSTKEGGICSVRVNEALRGDRGGLIRNAHGLRTEKDCWGRRAAWTDYSGVFSGKALGVAILDHPRNFRFPTFWHVRDYGLFTANPFGHKDFGSAWTADGSYLLKKGEELPFRYRLWLHGAQPEESELASVWRNFASA